MKQNSNLKKNVADTTNCGGRIEDRIANGVHVNYRPWMAYIRLRFNATIRENNI